MYLHCHDKLINKFRLSVLAINMHGKRLHACMGDHQQNDALSTQLFKDNLVATYHSTMQLIDQIFFILLHNGGDLAVLNY